MSELAPLYQIADSYRALLDMDIPEEQLADTLELVKDEFQDKARGIGFVLETMDANESALSAHLEDVKRRLDAIKGRKQRLKDYLHYNMTATGISKIESPYFTISLQKSPESVVIDNENVIPDDYTETVRKVSKSLVKKALKDGYIVPGAHLEQGTHVRIR